MQAVLVLVAVGILVLAAITDARSRRIPNPLPLALALIGLVRIGAMLATGGAAAAAAADLAAASAVFIIAAAAFCFGLLGGGDTKLLAGAALWLGVASVGAFLLATALIGGLLALGWLVASRLHPGVGATGVPYGIAIAGGGILASTGAI